MSTSRAKFNKTILANGIRIVSEKIPSVRSVSIGAWLNSGSRDEVVQNNGISHYLEHMVFKGTSNRSASDIAQSLESVGGHLNAFTGKELTCYYAHILDEHLPLSVDVIADILTNPMFDLTEMEKEKRVILEELSTLEETPEELIHDFFLDDLFPGHSLGFSVIGKRENITSFNKKTLVEYQKNGYTTDRLVIAAAGNVEHGQLVDFVTKNFESFANRGGRKYLAPNGPLPGKNIIENGAIQAHLCIGTHAYSYRDPKKFALLVLNTLLGSGMSSRLFQNIREKHGIAYSVYSFIDFLYDTGLFGIYIGTDKSKIDDSIELINKELVRLMEEPVSNGDLEKTKSQLKGNLMLGLESTSSRMNRLAKMEIYLQKHFTLDDTINEIAKVTQTDLLEVANELFTENRMHATILRPKSKNN